MTNVVSLRNTENWERALGQEPVITGGNGGGNGIEPPGEKAEDVPMKERLARIEQAQEGTRHSHVILLSSVTLVSGAFLAVLAVLAAFQVFTFQSVQSLDAKLSVRSDTIESKVDALPSKLADEFRAIRAEAAAQTSAIANSITAARGAPTQVILVPPPQPSSNQPER